MQEMVSFFWETLHSMSSRVKHFYADPSLCGHKLARKAKKVVYRLSRALLFQCISYWVVEFLQRYGINPAALEPFSSIDANVIGESHYDRIKTLRLLSLSLRMKSKVPKLFGNRFHAMVSQKVRPVLDQLFRLCTEMVSLHDADDSLQDATPLCSKAHKLLSDGLPPVTNPFPEIYEAIVEFLPLAVDRARKDVRELSKGYPASWPDHTPPPIKRKSKEHPSNTESTENVIANAEVLTTSQPASEETANIFVTDQAVLANTRSKRSCDDSCAGSNQPPNGLCARGKDSNQESCPKIRRPSVTSANVQSKRHICGECKDGLYTFFSDSINQGFTLGAIGLKLWTVLRSREGRKHESASRPDDALASDEEGAEKSASAVRSDCSYSDSDVTDADATNNVGPRTPPPRRCFNPHSLTTEDEYSQSQVGNDEQGHYNVESVTTSPSDRIVLPSKRRKSSNVSFYDDPQDRDSE
jgi:hypothetical protein